MLQVAVVAHVDLLDLEVVPDGLVAALGTGAHIRVTGKGRKKRATTLTSETVKVMRQWVTECHGQPADPLFPTRQGHPL